MKRVTFMWICLLCLLGGLSVFEVSAQEGVGPGVDVTVCAVPLQNNNECTQCRGDDDIPHRCDQSQQGSRCVGQYSGPLIMCVSVFLDCGGSRWEYPTIEDCFNDVNGMNVGDCPRDYEFSVSTFPLLNGPPCP